MMSVGDIVFIKGDNRLLGEIVAIDDMDRATIKLCDSGIEILADISNLVCTGSNQPKRKSGDILHILGVEYKILILERDDYRYSESDAAFMDFSTKELLICNYTQDTQSVKDLIEYQRVTIRHEIVHAFLYESGLWASSFSTQHWAQNEEMVDWIAIQAPKLTAAFKEAKCE